MVNHKTRTIQILKGLLILGFFFIFPECAKRPFPYIRETQVDRSQDINPWAFDLFCTGQLYEMQGNRRFAVAAYKKALEYDSRSATLFTVTGRNLLLLGNFKEAESYLKKAVYLDSRREEAFRLLGDIYLNQNELDECIQYYTKVLGINPNDKKTIFSLAAVYESMSRFDKAAELLEDLLVLNEDSNDKLLEKLALLYVRNKNYEKGIVCYEKILKHQPAASGAILGLALIFEAQENHEQALEMYRQLVGLETQNLNYRKMLANGYLQLNFIDSAIVQYQKIVLLDSSQIQARRNLAILHYEKKEYAQGLALLESTIKLAPEDPELYYYSGCIEMELADEDTVHKFKHQDAALICFNKAIALDEQKIESYVNSGLIYLDREDYTRAEEIYNDLIKLFPENSYAHYLLGVTYKYWKKYKESVEIFERVIKMDSDNKKALFELASTYEQTGSFEKSILTFKRLLNLDPDNSIALNYLGYILADKNVHLEEAKGYIEKALKIDPTNGAYLDSYGWVFYRMGDLESARVKIEEAVKYLGDDPVIYEHLGEIYHDLGKRDEALRHWKKSLGLNPQNEKVRDKIKSIEKSNTN